ncbi:MAG: hypothetical protein JNK77_16360 [Saprospiraceae bacterium]|nr:hypothetical protein [Saprospiraceae bacterium]
MNKRFLQVMAVAIIAFCTWTYMRNSIWDNRDLFPSESIMIYARDSSSFFIVLRLVFVAMWAWGVSILWTTGRAANTWLAVIFYAGFLLLDNLVLASHYLQFKAQNDLGESAFPFLLFRGIPEAVFTLLFNVLAIWFLKESWKKRQQKENGENAVALNIHS